MATKVNPPIEPIKKTKKEVPVHIETAEVIEPIHPSNAQKWTVRSLYVALIIIALGLGIFLKWSFADSNVLTVNNEPFPVRTVRENPDDNGVVILKVDFCKNTPVEGDLRLSFVSKDREVFLPITRERTPKGCQITEFPIIIPTALEPGTYKVKFKVIYNLNPLKRGISDEFLSKEFTVAPADIKPAE